MAGEQQRAEHREVTAGSAAAVLEHARVLADDVPRAGRSRTCSSVASRSDRIPSTAAAASHSARRAAYVGADERAGHARVHDDDRDPRRDRDRGDGRSRQSIRSACPARPKSEASWSISPPGTPVAAISAADANRAASTPATGVPASVGQGQGQRHRQRRARRQPRSDGDGRADRELGGGDPYAPVDQRPDRHPPTKRPQAGTTVRGSSPPSTATVDRARRRSSETAATAATRRGTAVTVHARSIASGRTKPVVVIGVVAHEVHAAGSDVAVGAHLGGAYRTRAGARLRLHPGRRMTDTGGL